MQAEHPLAIVAHNVGVRFDLDVARRRTLRQTFGDFVHRRRKGEPFWALQDVSITVRSGEVLGVVGRNGSGKSTLLLVLAGILRPDTGIVRVFGKTSTLLTLGAGFQPELTGRENIFLSGAFLGYGRKTMDELVDPIVEFSGLGDFIDVPIRKYSAGMRARLGFSIASHVEPDILLLDEVLGVGDEEFKKRSRDRINDLVARARSIVVVSHDLGFVERTCTRAVWLENGGIEAFGDPTEVVRRYRAAAEGTTATVRAPAYEPSRGAEGARNGQRVDTGDTGSGGTGDRRAYVAVRALHRLTVQEPGTTTRLRCRIHNGNQRLVTGGETPINLGYRLFDRSTGAFLGHGPRTAIRDLSPGETLDVDVAVDAPPKPGDYEIHVGLVHEQVAWLEDLLPNHAVCLGLDVRRAREVLHSADAKRT
jgi:ABC-2 type transport system ATP-binding protein